MIKIMVDAGHGPNTPGKRSPDGTLREYQFNVAVADRIKPKLERAGITVLFSHPGEMDVPLLERTNRANQLNVDAFVSIHANAHGETWNHAEGIETYAYPGALSRTTSLAELVQRSLIMATGRKDRGVKQANFAVLRDTNMPAILVECGFMTNKKEAELLKQVHYQEQCAYAIAFAIIAWVYRMKDLEL
ncbi:MAG TPA: N-acetylmuramoyl-L-alanine amidase [Sporosarcina sp.]|nr:N-acetylmuramoyl-L-alanine amidase [Sporosarcina sp.]